MFNSQFGSGDHVSSAERRREYVNRMSRNISRDDERVVSLRDVLSVIRRRFWTVILMTIVLTGAVVGYTIVQPSTHTTSATMILGQKQKDGVTSSSLTGDVQGLQQLAETTANMVSTRPVAQGVIERLNLSTEPESLLKNLDAQVVEETLLIEVSYTDTDPQKASRITNTVVGVFSQQVSEITPNANAIITTAWEPAVSPNDPDDPEPIRNAILALLLGLMLGVGLAFLMEYLDDGWRSIEEVEQVSRIPTLAVIPKSKPSATNSR